MDYRKLSPTLVAALDDLGQQGLAGLQRHVGLLGLVSVDPTPKPARVVVFLHCAENASLDHLTDLGVEVNGGGGKVRTGIVPLDSVDRLSEDPAIERIVPARRLRPLLDLAKEKVHVPQLRAATGLSGKGVIVGIVDSGIETRHPNFEGRILQVWDQTLNGAGVPEGLYGAELTGDQLLMTRDTNGHGTHVSGIAASADATFTGVAPEADLIMVKTDMLTAHIADGVQYIFRVAGQLGRPAVVNLSLGGHGDSHDGTDSLSAVIDAEVGPGRIVCVAAGNEGNDNIHVQFQMPRRGTKTVPLALPALPAGVPPPAAALNGWYSGRDRLDVAIVSPSNLQTPFQGVVDGDNPSRSYDLPEGKVQVITPGADPANGDINFIIEIEPAAAPATPPAGGPRPKGGAWRLRLRSTKISRGKVDVWSIDEGAAQFTGPTVQDSMKIGAPGTATRAITVAAYTTRANWENIFGDAFQSGLEQDEIADFSSEGPRRDGAQKPDVTAPGAMIVSCLSGHSPITPALLIDALNTIMAGTSQASPFVSGLVALLLERNPQLTPEGAKQLLRAHSRVPRKPRGVWDPKWGFGLVDARTLVPKTPKPVKKAAGGGP